MYGLSPGFAGLNMMHLHDKGSRAYYCPMCSGVEANSPGDCPK
jgi:hypothetical protein